VKPKKANNPLHVGFLGARRIVFDPQNFAHLVEQLALGIGKHESRFRRSAWQVHDERNSNNDRPQSNKILSELFRGSAAKKLSNPC
jgi:hypothetical protein